MRYSKMCLRRLVEPYENTPTPHHRTPYSSICTLQILHTTSFWCTYIFHAIPYTTRMYILPNAEIFLFMSTNTHAPRSYNSPARCSVAKEEKLYMKHQRQHHDKGLRWLRRTFNSPHSFVPPSHHSGFWLFWRCDENRTPWHSIMAVDQNLDKLIFKVLKMVGFLCKSINASCLWTCSVV